MKTDDKGPEKATTHHPSKGIRNMKKLQVAVLLFHTLSFVTAANFEPYELNGGLISAVAGNDFCIVGADTRMIGSGGYLLSSRNHLSSRLWSIDDSKLMDDIEESLRSNSFADDKSSPFKKLFDLPQAPIMIGAAGCTADCSALKNVIRADIRAASHLGQIAKQAKPDQVASLVSQTLYSRRGFPYYSFCCVAGINGVYVFDAVGSYEQVAVATAGTGRETLQPILDRSFRSTISEGCQVDCTVEEAIENLVKAYRSVSEREIGVGDKLVLHVSEKNHDAGGVHCKILVFPLKQH